MDFTLSRERARLQYGFDFYGLKDALESWANRESTQEEALEFVSQIKLYDEDGNLRPLENMSSEEIE